MSSFSLMCKLRLPYLAQSPRTRFTKTNHFKKQAKFVLEYAKSGNATQAHIAAGYKGTEDSHHANSSRLIGRDNVKGAYMSLLRELEPEYVEDLKLTKVKILEDLEHLKRQAAKNIADGKGGGGAYAGFTRATELQGRELGMFAQKYHHEHELSIVPDKDLLLSLAKSSPALAREMSKYLGVDIEDELTVIEAEFEVIEEEKT